MSPATRYAKKQTQASRRCRLIAQERLARDRRQPDAQDQEVLARQVRQRLQDMQERWDRDGTREARVREPQARPSRLSPGSRSRWIGSSCSPTASPSTRSGSGASSWSTRVTPTPSCKTFSRRCAPGMRGARTCLSRCASIRRSSRLVHASRVHTMSRPLDRCPGGGRRSLGQSAAPCQKHNGTLIGTSWGVAGLLPEGAMPPGVSPRPRPGPRADAAT